jgi:catechol 2,3-dioxygenase-like lactoylglutathione lyase family enzyme
MTKARLNHVSISARDMDESVRFYTEVFGMEELPAPDFGYPLRWLRVGDLELHLFPRPEARTSAHFALEVDDFDALYRQAKERGILDGSTHRHHLWELQSGEVQLYLRDPADNLIEVVWPDARTLAPETVADMKKRESDRPRSADNLGATLFLTRQTA